METNLSLTLTPDVRAWPRRLCDFGMTDRQIESIVLQLDKVRRPPGSRYGPAVGQYDESTCAGWMQDGDGQVSIEEFIEGTCPIHSG